MITREDIGRRREEILSETALARRDRFSDRAFKEAVLL